MTPRQRVKLFRRELGAFAGRLNRSHAGSSTTGSFLENVSKLTQILAIVVGGAWVLNDYFEFKKHNDKLTITQNELAKETAILTQSSIRLNNDLNTFKLENSTVSRLDTVSDSSVVRSTKLADGSFIYRFTYSIHVKNVSDAPIVLPAFVLEFFVGTPADNLKPDQAFLINPPSSSLAQPMPGNKPGYVTWTRRAQYANKQRNIDKSVEDAIPLYDSAPDILLGEIRSGEETYFKIDFAFRAQPKELAGAVLTFWSASKGEQSKITIEGRTELLSEAEDARLASLDKLKKRTQNPHTASEKK